MSKIMADNELAQMVKAGWPWIVIPWTCAEVWPLLPDVMQRALNATNSIGSSSTELEVAASIASYAAMAERRGDEPDWDSCAAAATAGSPPCSAYAKTLALYCRKFGGGPGCPMVTQLDAYAKQHNMNLRLGEEFWQAVVQTTFAESSILPRVRNAILLTQLTSPRQVEGVAKLISKTDINGLKDNKKLADLKQLEKNFELVDLLVKDIENQNLYWRRIQDQQQQ